MNYDEVNKNTAAAIRKNMQRNIFANHWETSAKMLSAMAIKRSALDAIGSDESFLQRSKVFPVLLDQLNIDELSFADAVNLIQMAKAIEDADVKSATYIRDTSGGKPTDKHDIASSNITNLTDNQLNFLLEHAEVVDETDN